jgi:15-cis-phytoene synthase
MVSGPLTLICPADLLGFGKMTASFEQLSPPQRLAIVYAPAKVRDAFALLLQFDERLSDIVSRISEPMIGQLKLAWWRDALNAAPGQRPKGEPLLSALSELDKPGLTTAAHKLVDAWEMLLMEEQWSDALLDSFATARGEAVFEGFARLLENNRPVGAMAQEWAKRDLAARYPKAMPATLALRTEALPSQRILRPLTLLVMLSRGVSGPRLIWHGLTGR